MPAHVEVINPGPRARVICPQCNLAEEHRRTQLAQAACSTHNTDHHPRTTTTEEHA